MAVILSKPVNLKKRTTPNADTAVRSGLAPTGRLVLAPVAISARMVGYGYTPASVTA